MSRLSLRPYAQAYLQASSDPRAAVAAFDMCAQAVMQVPGLRGFLADPSMPSDTRRKALALAAPNQPEQTYNLFLLLAKDRRLRTLPALGALLREEAAVLSHKKHAVVTSAIPLPAPFLQRITAALSTLLKQDIWLESRVDPTVIAGLRVQAGDWVFDATRHGRIRRLEQSLTL
ncbi:MAG: hypothetical protein RL141_881 [Candidatus Parcubacteria bacterium]|jgi:F-type H+-transporting ATPase subunit delta